MRKKPKSESQPIFSAVEVFGSTLGLLIVLFLILITYSNSDIEARLKKTNIDGAFKISWGPSSNGFVILLLPDSLRILETGKTVPIRQICNSSSPFVSYAKKTYNSLDYNQLIFVILSKATSSMRSARDCLQLIFGRRRISIGWIIANDELLKAVKIDQIPPYIKKQINKETLNK